MNKQSLILTIVVAMIVGAGAFYGGMVFAKNKTPSPFAGAGGTAFRQGGGNMVFTNGRSGTSGARMAAGFTNGSVVSNDGSTIVVSLPAGGSKNILVASSTQFVTLQKGSASDVSNGKDVIVTGTPNADGSITATMVQVRPADLENLPGFGGRRTTGTESGQNPGMQAAPVGAGQ